MTTTPDDKRPALDLRGLKCPLPVLRTRKILRAMKTGDPLLVLCTDPMAAIDIPHLIREGGDLLEAQEVTEGILRFWLRKGEER
jgi:tRNA 2-thiouridine synthesizing protein A